ncbi:copper transport protein ATOX1-like [Varroa jacobsoni]|uniref:Copper transport protein ATOX1 n=1 Tax=Varroa destructor TaxID=109461 RepID=A0A7M7K9S4_VARDE|nr:copper transport protein ATOX1-like [Varroa destructor]XP_022703311.1 copper transport protein ATOX1-like [Varroa jacobsoni]
MSKVYEFEVEMTCEGCSGAVKRVLGKLDGQGVTKVEIDLPNKRVFITSTLTSDQLLEVIKKTGKNCSYIGEKQ